MEAAEASEYHGALALSSAELQKLHWLEMLQRLKLALPSRERELDGVRAGAEQEMTQLRAQLRQSEERRVNLEVGSALSLKWTSEK